MIGVAALLRHLARPPSGYVFSAEDRRAFIIGEHWSDMKGNLPLSSPTMERVLEVEGLFPRA